MVGMDVHVNTLYADTNSIWFIILRLLAFSDNHVSLKYREQKMKCEPRIRTNSGAYFVVAVVDPHVSGNVCRQTEKK